MPWLKFTIRGCRCNGLPVRTLICVVVALNLARHAGGCYVDPGISTLARDLSGPQWGGCWWYPLSFHMPGPSRAIVPEGTLLS